LPRALASIPRASSVLVLDAQSDDETVTVARTAGATVIVRPWEGFVCARRFALEQVRTPWTFMLDADEVLDECLREAVLAAPPSAAIEGFLMKRTTFLCGCPIRGAGWGDESLLRLFRTARARLQACPAGGGTAELHEQWHVDGGVESLPGLLLHDSYPSIASYWKKFDRYTSIEARALPMRLGGVLRAAGIAPLRCLWLFLGRAGYRDGWRGAFVSLGSAMYPMIVAWKAWRRKNP
jgi:glycosyltransferase involved in cell wall biosynthesis